MILDDSVTLNFSGQDRLMKALDGGKPVEDQLPS